MTGNSTLWNIIKYTKVVWNFLNERYFKRIPFGKELRAVAAEITNEVIELKHLPSIRYFFEKYNELKEDVKWFYDYFDVGTRIRRVVSLVHLKLTEITQTALQVENRYYRSTIY